MGVLDDILGAKQREITALGGAPLPAPPPRRETELARPAGAPLRIIAEIKHRSPSAGELSRALPVEERARRYERAGAALVSVLTDQSFFGGSYEDLTRARAGTTLPILAKEFVLDERQLERARAFGADAVLLIVRILDARRLGQLLEAARGLSLEPLVEVTSHDEARVALGAGAELIGVNARDLDTLRMDPARAAAVLASLPRWVTSVHLSGLASADDVARIARSPAHAALVGEALMRTDDPEPLLAEWVRAAG